MYVTEDTTRANPDTLRALYTAAIRAGARAVCVCDTVGHSTPDGVRAVVRFVRQIIEDEGGGIRLDWHGHQDRGLGVINSIAAIEAGADQVHGSALGVGERVGNTPMDQLLVNLKLMNWIDNDLSKLGDYCRAAESSCGWTIPVNYPVFGRDAFRTATGVHAGGSHQELQERRHGTGRPHLFGCARRDVRDATGDRSRPDERQVERHLLARIARPRSQR
jgi:2-isopropylmalate synthase